jgi:SSS family solute:Na+ symporter
VAVLIAALISTIDSGLNSLSTVFTLDIYCKVFRKNAANEEIAWTGRVVTIAAAVVAVFFALALESVEKMNLFDLLQSIISFLAPPMAVVFLVGVLWNRATSTAALSTLVVGTAISLSIGGCYLAHWPSEEFWPHFLLLSFYLFATLVPLMILVSLVTKPPSADKQLPSLKEAYAQSGHSSKQVWMLWAFLAAIMFSLYVFFN